MVEYKFYLNTYKGASLSQDEWPLYEARAADQLAFFKRTYTITAPDESSEAMAVCAMADALAYYTAAQNGAAGSVSAASVGSVSISYGSSVAVDLSPRAQERELFRCAAQHMEICRGVG